MIVLQALAGLIVGIFLMLFLLLAIPLLLMLWAVGIPVYIKTGNRKDVYRWFTKIRTEVAHDD